MVCVILFQTLISRVLSNKVIGRQVTHFYHELSTHYTPGTHTKHMHAALLYNNYLQGQTV